MAVPCRAPNPFPHREGERRDALSAMVAAFGPASRRAPTLARPSRPPSRQARRARDGRHGRADTRQDGGGPQPGDAGEGFRQERQPEARGDGRVPLRVGQRRTRRPGRLGGARHAPAHERGGGGLERDVGPPPMRRRRTGRRAPGRRWWPAARCRARPRPPRPPCPQGVRRALLDRGGHAQRLDLGRRADGRHVRDLGPAFDERAGLVEGDRASLTDRFQGQRRPSPACPAGRRRRGRKLGGRDGGTGARVQATGGGAKPRCTQAPRSPGRTSPASPTRRRSAGVLYAPLPLLDARRPGDQRRQGADTGARPTGGDLFQHLAEGEEEHRQRRLLGRADGDEGRDAHRRLDREGLARPRQGDRAPAEGVQGDQGNSEIEPIGSRGTRCDRPHAAATRAPRPRTVRPLAVRHQRSPSAAPSSSWSPWVRKRGPSPRA